MVRPIAEFLAAIDCRFPYGDRALAHALIDEACAISSDAAFMVAHELARRPASSNATDAVCLDLLSRLHSKLVHPLKPPVLGIARRMVRGESVPFEELCGVMRAIEAHRGEFNALVLVTFACEDGCIEAVKAIHDEVVDGWTRSRWSR